MVANAVDTANDLWQRLRAFRVTHPAHMLQVGDVRWYYLVGGQGEPPLVIPPGGTRVPDMAFTLAEALETRRRLVMPAYPAVPTMADLVAGLAAVLDELGLQQADFLGSSFGGFVTQCFVHRHPGRVRRMILAHTAAPPLPAKQRYVAPLTRWVPESLLRPLMRRTVLSWIAAPPEQQEFWLQLADEILGQWTHADLIAECQEMTDFAWRCRFTPADLSGWPGRILILESEDDQFADVGARTALHALYPTAEVHTFRGERHSAMLTRTDEYVAVVDQFLAAPD